MISIPHGELFQTNPLMEEVTPALACWWEDFCNE